MRKYLLLLMIFSLSLTGNAQNKKDKIYLKNRSILRGTIVEKTDSIVRIIVIGGNVWSVPTNYIAGIGKERAEKQQPAAMRTERTINKEKGYNLITNFGVYFRLSGEKSSYFHGSVVNSYSLWPNLSVGLGIGIDRDVRTFFPIFADVRYYLNRKYFAPFVAVSCGKAIASEKNVNYMWRNMENYGGLYFSSSLGIEFPMNEKTSFLLTMEYKYQKNNYKSIPIDVYYEIIEETNRFGIKLGILFN